MNLVDFVRQYTNVPLTDETIKLLEAYERGDLVHRVKSRGMVDGTDHTSIIAWHLNNGEKVTVVTDIVSAYLDGVIKNLNEKYGIEVEAKPFYSKKQRINIDYDKFSEPIGFGGISEEVKFCGYILEKKQIQQ